MTFAVCILCGSSSVDDPRYVDAARETGSEIVRRGWTPAYGDARVGLMGELSDAFLSLPGGIGTLDEQFEAWSWSQVGLQRKPSGLLNVGGYYDALVSFADRATAAGFVRPQHRQLLTVSDDVGALLDGFRRPQPPP